MLDGKLNSGETYKKNDNNFDPSNLYPLPHTDWQFTRNCKVFNFQHFGVMKKKKNEALYTVPFLVLFKTQRSPSELKPTAAEVAPAQSSFHECE